MIFMDSDAIIAFLRGRPSLAAFFAKKKNSIFAITTPVLYEIYYVLVFPRLSKRFMNDTVFMQRLKKEEQRLIQLLNNINIFDLDVSAIKKSAEISATLDANGFHVGKMDVLIAGIILANGHNELLTNNISHYERIPDLVLYSF